jgi:hypothetical protein
LRRIGYSFDFVPVPYRTVQYSTIQYGAVRYGKSQTLYSKPYTLYFNDNVDGIDEYPVGGGDDDVNDVEDDYSDR